MYLKTIVSFFFGIEFKKVTLYSHWSVGFPIVLPDWSAESGGYS